MSNDKLDPRGHKEKFETGEWVLEFNGYTPTTLGCFMGNTIVLGGEEEFSHCYGSFHGICEFEYWITKELEKLSDDQVFRLVNILQRNKDFDAWKSEQANFLASMLGIGSHHINRIPSKDIYDFFKNNSVINQYSEIGKLKLENEKLSATNLNQACIINDLQKELVSVQIENEDLKCDY